MKNVVLTKSTAFAKNAVTGKTLVIAEKPSVAQDIVRALTATAGKFEKHDEFFESEGYVVTSAVATWSRSRRPSSTT